MIKAEKKKRKTNNKTKLNLYHTGDSSHNSANEWETRNGRTKRHSKNPGSTGNYTRTRTLKAQNSEKLFLHPLCSPLVRFCRRSICSDRRLRACKILPSFPCAGGLHIWDRSRKEKEKERRKEEHPRNKKPNTKKIAGRLRSLSFLRMSPRFWTHMEVVQCYPLGFEHSEQFSPSTVFSRFTICTPKHWWNGSFLAKWQCAMRRSSVWPHEA